MLAGCPHTLATVGDPPEPAFEVVGDALAGTPPDAVLWQGFVHDWTHNHRWKRLGNLITPCDDPAERCHQFQHGAASGTSGDRALWTTQATGLWRDDPLPIATTVTSFPLQIPDGVIVGWSELRPVELPLSTLSPGVAEALTRGPEPVGFLQGFDLVHVEGAPLKPITFLLDVVDTAIVGDRIRWTIRSRVAMGCATGECRGDGDVPAFSAYRLSVALGVATPDASVVGEDRYIKRTWDTKDRTQPELPALPLDGFATDHTLVFQALGITLSAGEDAASKSPEQHMVGWRSMLYDDPAGVWIDFRQWRPGMRDIQPTAFDDPGEVLMTVRAASLQFDGAARHAIRWTGGLDWIAGADASTGVVVSRLDAEGWPLVEAAAP